MNRRNFFSRMTTGLSLLLVGGKAKTSKPTVLYRWDTTDGGIVTLEARTPSEQEIAAAVHRELLRILEDV